MIRCRYLEIFYILLHSTNNTVHIRTIFWMVLLSLPVVSVSQLPGKAEDVKPLKIGETIPSLNVKSIAGETIPISNLLKEKPTVLIFYRGGWCPYCNQHLAEMADDEERILAMGYQIVAISMNM